MRLAVLLAALPACSLYFHDAGGGGPEPDAAAAPGDGASLPGQGYTLARVKAIGGEHQIAGIDSDRAGGIWIAYRDPTGGYYAPADVWITHLDASGAKLSEWYFHDDYTPITGIAYTGDALWVSYNDSGSGDEHLRQLDPATGATLSTFATPSGVTDVSFGDGALWLSEITNQVLVISPTTGGTERSFAIMPVEISGQFGIAYAAGKLWIVDGLTPTFLVVDPTGATIGHAATWGIFEEDPVDLGDIKLAWDGSGLVAATSSQIIWISVQPM